MTDNDFTGVGSLPREQIRAQLESTFEIGRSDLRRALEIALDIRAHVELLDDRGLLAYTYRIIAGHQVNLTLYDDAHRSIGQALLLSAEVDDRLLLGQIHRIASAIEHRRGNNVRALDHAYASLDACEGSPKGIAYSLKFIGIVYRGCREFERSISVQKRALKIAREIGASNLEADMFMELGSTYSGMKQYDRALRYYRASLRMAIRREHSVAISGLKANIGFLYNTIGHQDRALRYLRGANRAMRSLGDRNGRLRVLIEIGTIHADRGEYERAQRILLHALAIAESLGSRIGSVMVVQAIAACDRGRGMIGEAIGHLERALELMDGAEEPSTPTELLRDLIAALESAGELERARGYRIELDQIGRLQEEWRRAEAADLERILAQIDGRALRDRDTPSRDLPSFDRILLDRYPALTVGEVKVCLLLREGLSSKEIADRLGISSATVDTHRRRIRKKLDLDQTTNLVTFLATLL